MDKSRWIAIAIGVGIVVVLAVALSVIIMPGGTSAWQIPQQIARYAGTVPGGVLLRVPVSGIYPGGTTAGLNAEMKNPLVNDPDAAERGMKDFGTFNCSGCHDANGGGGMGPSLSDDTWLYRASPANIYLSIVQGRGAGMPAFGAMLPDRTVWELVAYIQSISRKPGKAFGTTTSLAPQSPSIEQVPAGRMQTTVPWKFTEPMPKNGERPGTSPG